MDWDQFYEEKEKNNLIKFTKEEDQKRMYSPAGEPLLLVCIKNESSTESWHLKKMLKIILSSGNFALYDSLNGSPLNVALEYNCFESLQIMKNGDLNFDLQM